MKTLAFFLPLIFTAISQLSHNIALSEDRGIVKKAYFVGTIFKSKCEPLSDEIWAKNTAFVSLGNFVLESM